MTQRFEIAVREVRHGAVHFASARVQHANAHLHGHRHAHRRAYRRHALGDPGGLPHQAGAEGAAGHALAGAAAVEVDLIVARLFPGTRRGRELTRLAAAELQCEWVLCRVEGQQPCAVATQDRRRGDHLGVQQHIWREAAQEIPAMAVGPVHHRGHGNSSIQLLICYRVFLHGVRCIEIGRTDMGDDR